MLHLFLILLFSASIHCQSNESMGRNVTLQVTGISSQSINNTLTYVHLTVENEAVSATSAQQRTALKVQSVLNALQPYNVTELETDQFSLQPVYNYTEDPTKIIGYSSSSEISYKVNSTLAGMTLDAAVSAGANRIDSVQNVADTNSTDTAYIQSLQGAVQNAQDKANAVASALSMCLGIPTSVQIESRDSGGIPFPIMMEATTSTESSVAPTIVPGSSDVSATVFISYELKTC